MSSGESDPRLVPTSTRLLAGRPTNGYGEPQNVFPFFVGFARSGTTLLRAMFDSHPRMAIPGESHFIIPLARNRQRYERPEGFDTEAFLSELLDHPRFRRWGLPDDDLRRTMTSVPPPTLADALRRAYELYTGRRGKDRYGDKTPAYLRHLPLLSALFREARFVHILRDGRDVALSHLEVGFRSTSVAEISLGWRRAVRRCRHLGWQLGAAAYRELRYEDLVENPEETLRSLCEFVDLDFDDRMLRYFERADEVIKPVRDPHAHRHLSLPPTKGLRDWRRQMQKDDVAMFEALAGDLLSELGYERAVERLGLRARLKAAGRKLQLGTRRTVHRIGKKAGVRPSGPKEADGPAEGPG